MAYHQSGDGAPVLFLHGNPTSSFLWRNVIPFVQGFGRIIVPDLIGMGDSDKLPTPGPQTYSFATHRSYLWQLIEKLVAPTLVADYANWMAQNELPKLFVNAEPGAILTGEPREFCRTWRNQTEVTVPGTHFIQEDSASAIGQAIAEWFKTSLR